MATHTATPQPVLRVTLYDLVSSWLIVLVGALIAAVFLLTVAWFATSPQRPKGPVKVEMVEVPGGVEDGSPDETLKLDGEGPESELAAPADEISDQPEVEETLDTVMDLAAEATNQSEKQFEFQTRNAGPGGSAKGTSNRASGMGPGKGGMPREQRWFISYNERETIEEYARQLDYWGIELGLLTADGNLIYLSRLSQPQPVSRRVTSGKDEQRLFMTWQGGARRRADILLYQKAGIDVGNGTLMQFFSPKLEEKLLELELAYRKRKLNEIRRTYFTTQRNDEGYDIIVTRQVYFQ